MKFYPYKNEGGGGVAEKVLAMLNRGRGHTQFWGSFFAVALEVLAIMKGARKTFPPFKKGGITSFGPVIFPFCGLPSPSLRPVPKVTFQNHDSSSVIYISIYL